MNKQYLFRDRFAAIVLVFAACSASGPTGSEDTGSSSGETVGPGSGNTTTTGDGPGAGTNASTGAGIGGGSSVGVGGSGVGSGEVGVGGASTSAGGGAPSLTLPMPVDAFFIVSGYAGDGASGLVSG